MKKSFDVFLSHNSRDKPAVRELAEALRARGLNVWLDEWELVPGRRWQEALEEIIETTQSAAVLVGRDGFGPWQDVEMRGCLAEFVGRNQPVIPVLLPGAPAEPKLPLFLRQYTWVDLRSGLTAEGLDRLHWGVTGERPVPSISTASPEVAVTTAEAQPVSAEMSPAPPEVQTPTAVAKVRPGQKSQARSKSKRTSSRPKDDGAAKAGVPESPLTKPPSWRVLLLLNILLLALLNILLLALLAFVFSRFHISACVPNTVKALCLALLTLIVVHLACRYRLLEKIGRDRLDPLIKRLHPWGLSNPALWTAAAALAVAAAFFLWCPLSPFRLPELPAAVQGFTVRPRGGSARQLAVGDQVEIPFGESALVQAVVEGESSGCSWSAQNGIIRASTGCSAAYTAPKGKVRGTLSVLVNSPCGTYTTSASLLIEVTRHRP